MSGTSFLVNSMYHTVSYLGRTRPTHSHCVPDKCLCELKRKRREDPLLRSLIITPERQMVTASYGVPLLPPSFSSLAKPPLAHEAADSKSPGHRPSISCKFGFSSPSVPPSWQLAYQHIVGEWRPLGKPCRWAAPQILPRVRTPQYHSGGRAERYPPYNTGTAGLSSLI